MRGVIKQSVTLPASAKKLYNTYLSPRGHAAVTGAPVTVRAKPGSKFSGFGGAITGTILATVPGRLIVQSWRSTNFKRGDPDSVLTICFTPLTPKSARIDLIHVGVSSVDYTGVKDGWPRYYWKPWRKALAKR